MAEVHNYAGTAIPISITGDSDGTTVNTEWPGRYEGYNNIVAQLVVAAPSVTNNTPTLDVKVQESFDQTNWTDVLTFTQLTTTAGTEYKRSTSGPRAKYFRLNIVADTASATSTYTGTCYITLTV